MISTSALLLVGLVMIVVGWLMERAAVHLDRRAAARRAREVAWQEYVRRVELQEDLDRRRAARRY